VYSLSFAYTRRKMSSRNEGMAWNGSCSVSLLNISSTGCLHYCGCVFIVEIACMWKCDGDGDSVVKGLCENIGEESGHFRHQTHPYGSLY